jgi:hypothetical protein
MLVISKEKYCSNDEMTKSEVDSLIEESHVSGELSNKWNPLGDMETACG